MLKFNLDLTNSIFYLEVKIEKNNQTLFTNHDRKDVIATNGRFRHYIDVYLTNI